MRLAHLYRVGMVHPTTNERRHVDIRTGGVESLAAVGWLPDLADLGTSVSPAHVEALVRTARKSR